MNVRPGNEPASTADAGFGCRGASPTERGNPTLPSPERPLAGHAAVVGFYALLAVAWTWPWAAYDGTELPLRQFDLFGVLWVIDHAPDLLRDLRSTVSGMPFGEDVSRLDTWVLAAIGAALGCLDPVRVAQLVVLAGPTFSAFAAERCAVALGVPRPASVAAGLVYGFCGLGATALLEGHVYMLLVPWPPLLVRALLAATGPGGTARHGAEAGVWWALSLLTSGYVGLVAAVFALAMGVRGWFVRLDRRRLVAPALAFVAVGLAVGLPYTALFAAGEGGVAKNASMVSMAGSATLVSLATWTPESDVTNHSIAAPLGFVTLALVGVAPVVLRERRGWRTLAAVAVLGALASVGPAVQVGLGGTGTWHLVHPAYPPAWLAFLHFPIRLLWLWYLGAGLVAALVVTRLSARPGGWALLPLLVLDAFVTSGVAWRQGGLPTAVPRAYAAAPAGRPVLDLLAEDADAGSGVNLRVRRMACWYQVVHERPLAARCLTPHGAPLQEAAERALRSALLDGGDPRRAVQPLGLGAIAVHADLFRPEDRVRVLEGMVAAFGPPIGGESVAVALSDGPRDAGDAVVLFGVDAVVGTEGTADAPVAGGMDGGGGALGEEAADVAPDAPNR